MASGGPRFVELTEAELAALEEYEDGSDGWEEEEEESPTLVLLVALSSSSSSRETEGERALLRSWRSRLPRTRAPIVEDDVVVTSAVLLESPDPRSRTELLQMLSVRKRETCRGFGWTGS